jgi:hypothetical protein
MGPREELLKISESGCTAVKKSLMCRNLAYSGEPEPFLPGLMSPENSRRVRKMLHSVPFVPKASVVTVLSSNRPSRGSGRAPWRNSQVGRVPHHSLASRPWVRIVQALAVRTQSMMRWMDQTNCSLLAGASGVSNPSEQAFVSATRVFSAIFAACDLRFVRVNGWICCFGHTHPGRRGIGG